MTYFYIVLAIIVVAVVLLRFRRIQRDKRAAQQGQRPPASVQGQNRPTGQPTRQHQSHAPAPRPQQPVQGQPAVGRPASAQSPQSAKAPSVAPAPRPEQYRTGTVALAPQRQAASPQPAVAPAPMPMPPQPPGTRDLDEDTAVRPDIDPNALDWARAVVSPSVPDEVLSDALLDATPQQLANLLSNVSNEVVANAIGRESVHGVQVKGHARPEDLASLQKVADSVDDLELFNFDTEAKKA